MSILIIDDNAGIRELLALFLSYKGYTALGVANGAEALACEQPLLPQLILLDLNMPVMDGVTFRHARQHEAHLSGIPIAVMSAVEELPPRQIQVDAYLPKPIDFDALLPLVQQYC